MLLNVLASNSSFVCEDGQLRRCELITSGDIQLHQISFVR